MEEGFHERNRDMLFFIICDDLGQICHFFVSRYHGMISYIWSILYHSQPHFLLLPPAETTKSKEGNRQ